jgi:DNA sulfur modification protein DndD
MTGLNLPMNDWGCRVRIKRFELCNVGVFGGTHSFDLLLRSNDQRPRSIILFGGKNGSGKTTLLDGFRLCLYGRLALGAQVRKKQYEDYLRELLTRGVDGSKCENAYLRLEFDYGTMGETNDYIIMRSWRRKQDDSLDEHLEVFKDGRPLEHLDPSYWDDLVAELVPLGLSDLFFFDGERIQRLAEEDDHLVFFASVKSLLGLDLIDRLETDLDIFKDKQIREQVGVGDSCRIDELDRQVAEKNERLLRSQLERAELQTRLDAAHCSLKELETKFTHLGGKLARDRGELATRKALIHAEISMTEKRIRELTDGCFPFALCPSLTHDLLCQFGVEEQLLKNEGVRKTFENVISSVEKRLSGEKVPGSKSPQKLLSILREEIELQT